METMMDLRALTKEHPRRSSRSTSSSPPPSERMPRLCRPRERVAMRDKTAAFTDRSAAALSCCTPTPTPTATPLHTPLNTPSPTPPKGVRGDRGLPPVPPFSSRFSPSCATAEATTAAGCGTNGAKKGGRSAPRVFDDRAGPFAGQGAPFRGRAGGKGVAEGRRRGMWAGIDSGQPGQGRVQPENTTRVVPSVESEVAGMFDESQGTLRLAHDGLGDERVPSLTLDRLKEVYRDGRGSVCSWRTTAGLVNRGHGAPAPTPLIEVEQGRLGVLSSNDAYLFHFKEMKPTSGQQASIVEAEEDVKLHLVYVWMGREAGKEACTAARAQGKRLLEQQPPSTSQTPLLEVEQGCEPALFLALFSYMLPPLAAVVLQGRDETPDLRVLELQESPCLPGSGIVIAVEGPCSAPLLAKHGPLPDRSYICLVRPRRKVGGANEKGGVEVRGSEGVGTFDAAYYWHGVGETPAVEGVGILLCQQVDRMFPSPSIADCGKRRSSRRRRGVGGVGLGDGMMRGYVTDVKLGLPVPDGFWECLLPDRSTPSSIFASEDRRLLSQDLRPEGRSRPVRVFGVCAGSREARQSFVWELTSGGMPCQMRLSPSLSHVVDAGGSSVYVWHGNGSSGDGRRLACRVARAYAVRVDGGASVHEADAGSEPVGLLDCFIGWNQALVESPPMLSLSPGRRNSRLESSADISPLTTPATTPSRGASRSTEGMRSVPGGCHDQQQCGNRSPGGHGTSSGSSGSKLTPPGQRTPTLGLRSPPSLKNLAGGVYPPPRRRAASTEGMPASSEAFLTPPRRHEATCNPTTGGGGPSSGGSGFSSPPCLLGLTSCIDACTADRTMKPTQFRGGAASLLCGTRLSSSSGLDRPYDESSGSDSVRTPSEAGAGRRVLSHVGQDSHCTQRSTARVAYLTSAGHQCAGGQGEDGAGDDENQGEKSADGGPGKREHKNDDEGDSGRGGDEKNGAPGGWQNRDGGGDGDRHGGTGGSNDGDGATTSGESGTQDDRGEGIDEDDDGEGEMEECGEDEDMDTFLNLSQIELCDGIDVLQYGKSANMSRNSASLDSSIGSRSSGGGGENSLVQPRHLSDFFQSPHALDSTPRSSRRSGSYSMFDSTDVRAFSSTASGTSETTTSALVNCEDNPSLTTPAVSDANAIVPDSTFAEGHASIHHSSPVVRSLPTDEPLAIMRHVEVCVDPVLAEHWRPGAQVEHVESKETEAIEEEKEQAGVCDAGDREDSMGGDGGGGGESEEEWLTHPDSDIIAPELESWGVNSEDTLPSLGDHERTKPSAISTQEEGPKCVETATMSGHDWAGLNEDGSWRTEVARQAAGEAGAVEAERRRLAKINADESWRSGDGEADGMRCRSSVRRESISFTGLQTGNVRNKLNVFEGSSGAKTGKEKVDNRSSIGALHGRGLVSAWTKKNNNCPTPTASATEQAVLSPSPEEENPKTANVCAGDTSPPAWSVARQVRPPLAPTDDSEEDGEFLWKAGPAPCRLRGRPSLGLIRNGQVRIMTKALLLSCDEEGAAGERDYTRSCDEADTNHASRFSGESFEPPMPSNPPPPPPVATSAPPPVPVRPSNGGSNAERPPLPVRPITSSGAAKQRLAVPKGNFWLAKAGLTRKKIDGSSPASAPATPPRNGGTWRQGGGAHTPPPAYMAGCKGTGVAAEARVLDAASLSRQKRIGGAASTIGAWAKLHRRLEEEGKNLYQDTHVD